MKKTITVVLKFIAYFMIFIFANLGLIWGYAWLFNPNPQELVSNIDLVMTLSIMGTAIAVVVSKLLSQKWSKVHIKFNVGDFDYRFWRLILLASLGYSIIAALMVDVLIPYFPEYQELSNMFTGVSNSAWLFFLIVVIGPILEELLLRGVVMQDLMKDVSVPIAIVLQAVLFGLIHFNFIQSMYATLGGILLGCFYYYTKSLKASIVGHIAINFLGTVGSAVIGLVNNNLLLQILTFVLAVSLVLYLLWKMYLISCEVSVDVEQSQT
jgi:uncharacterized protein